ncbi:MAG: 3-oxoacyl-ACP reductase FabG [Candidatus Aenigmarchaeota archaeon]|nr:3-oxoacyl-ACP reductase FabG [Candidatus Aenigmarchaeota archaeon]
MRLKNRVALVTGGSRGIGAAIAVEFAKEGSDVAITYNKNRELAEKVKREIEKSGRKCIAIKCDVKSKKEVSRTIAAVIEKLGRIDILVNNAGVLVRGSLLNTDDKTWDETINTNLRGVFYCAKAVVPHMMKRKYGRIVNISSVAAFSTRSSSAVYAASKAGVAALTRIWSRELAEHNITVNAIAPGPVDTDMMGSASPDLIKKYTENIPLKRLAKPEDIAKAALFFASDDNSYVTGQVLVVSGGSM